jgi:arylsulfatase A-like enzyme
LRELARGEKPFFLFSSFWKPHSPFEVPVPFDSLYNDVDIPLPKIETIEEMRRLPLPVQKLALRGSNPPYGMDREELQWIYRSYYGSIAHIDREVGLILDTLDETGQADNTVVVFASDHGDQLLEHGIMGKNVFFEGSIRVPLTISFPSKITPGKYDDPIESIDLLPTLFELIGLPEPYACQGRTLMPLIGESEKEYRPREAVFSENVIPEIFGSTFQFEKDKGVKGIRHPDAKMVRTKRWKFNYYPEGFAELYDLENDPNEQRNLADDAAYKTVKEEMRERLLHWLTTSTETDQIAPKWLLT